jgi:L-ectoine synthase
MIVRSLEEMSGTSRDVDWGNGKSRRFLIATDRIGYSLTDTIVKAGSRSLLQYRAHLETCYCISGSGHVEDVKTGAIHMIAPGTMYALDSHDEHYLVAHEEMRLVCVFSPALHGGESHRLDGGASSSY